MGDVRLKLDDRIRSGEQVIEVSIVLKATRETVVKVPTNSAELRVGLISRIELLLEYYFCGSVKRANTTNT
jgi:hypothetical protein